VELDSSFVPSVGHDDGDVAYIQCRGGDVEYCDNSERAADADEVETAAENDDEPDSIYRGVGQRIDSTPKPIMVSGIITIRARRK
jgi:hypothetical protein